jgi:hypothetical protein
MYLFSCGSGKYWWKFFHLKLSTRKLLLVQMMCFTCTAMCTAIAKMNVCHLWNCAVCCYVCTQKQPFKSVQMRLQSTGELGSHGYGVVLLNTHVFLIMPADIGTLQSWYWRTQCFPFHTLAVRDDTPVNVDIIFVLVFYSVCWPSLSNTCFLTAQHLVGWLTWYMFPSCSTL